MCFFNMMDHLAEVQSKLASKVIKKDSFTKLEKIAGVDISFSKENLAIAAAVILDSNSFNILEKKTIAVELLFPYIPGFLGFREANAMVLILNQLESDFDVSMINGHGILHPRGFGLASHVGLLADVPTIGVAKRLIGGTYTYHGTPFKVIKFMNQTIGACVNGIYVSIGHKISLKTAVDLLLKMRIYKMPEPLRQAHILATKTAKQEFG